MPSVCKDTVNHSSARVKCPNCSERHVICLDENIAVYPFAKGLVGTVFRCQKCDQAALIDDLLSREQLKQYKEIHKGKPPKKLYLKNICMICRKKRIWYDINQNQYVCDECGELYSAYDLD